MEAKYDCFMESERPLVSLIVVSYNEVSHIKQSLDALMKVTYPKYEIIIYDNGSIDGTPDLISEHFPQVKLIRGQKNLGFGGANNEAAKIAQGKFVGFLNDDAIVAPDWLEPLVELLEADNTIGCVGAELLCSENNEIILGHGTSIHLSGISYTRDRGKKACPGAPIEVGGISGAAFLINRKLFLELGGFESIFFLYYEDTDLSLRIRLLGKRCVVVPGAQVYHNCESRFGVNKIFYLERNRYLSLLTLMKGPMLLMMAPSMLVFELFAWGYCLLSGRKALKSKIEAWRSIIALRDWIKARRARYAQSSVKVADLFQAFSPYVHIDYVARNNILGFLISLTGYIVAIPAFLLMRFWCSCRSSSG